MCVSGAVAVADADAGAVAVVVRVSVRACVEPPERDRVTVAVTVADTVAAVVCGGAGADTVGVCSMMRRTRWPYASATSTLPLASTASPLAASVADVAAIPS